MPRAWPIVSFNSVKFHIIMKLYTVERLYLYGNLLKQVTIQIHLGSKVDLKSTVVA